jgi:hypothetical protein
MFWKKPILQNNIPFYVFIALDNGEAVIEPCDSREHMMSRYFKIIELLKTESWISINDGTIRVSIIRYVKCIES